jgi:hypothetical protein
MSSENEPIDHEFTDEIVCPHCGYEEADSWEYEDDGKSECGGCEKEYYFERIVTVEYSTTKKKG